MNGLVHGKQTRSISSVGVYPMPVGPVNGNGAAHFSPVKHPRNGRVAIELARVVDFFVAVK